jgi:hypothetical protein
MSIAYNGKRLAVIRETRFRLLTPVDTVNEVLQEFHSTFLDRFITHEFAHRFGRNLQSDRSVMCVVDISIPKQPGF